MAIAGRGVDATSCVVDSQCGLGEAPLWRPHAATLCWLDIAIASTLFEWRPATGELRRRPLGELATGLALTDAGDLVIVSDAGLGIVDGGDAPVRRLVTPPFPMHGLRFNDCGCDPKGRLWTGTMVDDLRPGNAPGTGTLYRIDADLSFHAMADGIGCPNTFAWPLGGGTLLTADSATGCLYAFHYDAASGAISNRRVFAQPYGLGIPDGSAMDVDGYLWNARWGAGCVARFAPDGTLERVVPVPAEFVTSCAFGGPDLDTLFVTTARSRATAEVPSREPFAGGVFAFQPGVRGAPVPAFRLHRRAGT